MSLISNTYSVPKEIPKPFLKWRGREGESKKEKKTEEEEEEEELMGITESVETTQSDISREADAREEGQCNQKKL